MITTFIVVCWVVVLWCLVFMFTMSLYLRGCKLPFEIMELPFVLVTVLYGKIKGRG